MLSKAQVDEVMVVVIEDYKLRLLGAGTSRSVRFHFRQHNMDIRGSIRELAFCEGHAPQSAEIANALKAKHLAAPPHLNLPAMPDGEMALRWFSRSILSGHRSFYFHPGRLQARTG